MRSFQTTYRKGLVTFLHEPELSEEAQALLQTSSEAFRTTFGEYYVAAYVLGGSNASTLGGAAARAATSKDITGSYSAQIKWGLIKISGSFGTHESSLSAASVVALSGYDTLSNWSIDYRAADDA